MKPFKEAIPFSSFYCTCSTQSFTEALGGKEASYIITVVRYLCYYIDPHPHLRPM